MFLQPPNAHVKIITNHFKAEYSTHTPMAWFQFRVFPILFLNIHVHTKIIMHQNIKLLLSVNTEIMDPFSYFSLCFKPCVRSRHWFSNLGENANNRYLWKARSHSLHLQQTNPWYKGGPSDLSPHLAKDPEWCQHQPLVAKGAATMGTATGDFRRASAPGLAGDTEAGAFPEDRTQPLRRPSQEGWKLGKESE